MLTLNLAIVLLLILLNGFFAMAEIALVSARPARLQPMAANGNTGADAALELKADPSRLLATVQIGITSIAGLLGSFREATLGEDLQDYLEGYSGFFGHYAHAISMAAVVLRISYVSLILGELVPKRVAMIHPEGIAAALARVLRRLARMAPRRRACRARRPPCCCASRRRRRSPRLSPPRNSALCCAKAWRPATSRRAR